MNIVDLYLKITKTKTGEALWVLFSGVILAAFFALIISLILINEFENFGESFVKAFILSYSWFYGVSLPFAVMILLKWDNIENAYIYCAVFYYGGMFLSKANFDESFVMNLLISYGITFIVCYIAYRLINGNTEKKTFDEGFDKGFDRGKEIGFQEGYKKGYVEGWNNCVTEIEESKDIYLYKINENDI